MAAYRCSKCGIAVIVVSEQEKFVPCKCNAPIIADLSAKLKGKANVHKS